MRCSDSHHKATGKENKIVIKAGSGLSDAEVQQAILDAETHAEEDKQMRELVDARNNAEAMVHTVQKTLEEAGDKVDSTVRYEVETAVTDVEEAVKGDNAENITNKTNVRSSYNILKFPGKGFPLTNPS